MHSFYLRNMYLYNRMREPNGISLGGEGIDLRRITIPQYFLSTSEDHIAPWKSTYAGTQLVSGPVRFVLAASGHIAGVMNPPAAKRYGYWTNDKIATTPDEWRAGAERHEGSWWGDWDQWVSQFAGNSVPARQPGDGALTPTEDAPGAYVRATGTWDKPEQAFVERVQRVLHSLDVPTKYDIDALSKRVHELTKVADRLSAHLGETQSAAKTKAKKRIFRRGEPMEVCKQHLASGPKSTRELALAVMESKGLDVNDKVLAKTVAAQLIHALRMQCSRGKVLRIGKKGTALVWRLP